MDLATLLGSAVIAAIFSGLVSYIIARRQGNLQYITGERKEWREKIREIANKLDGASYKETLKILTELKVRINAFGNNALLLKVDWERSKDEVKGNMYDIASWIMFILAGIYFTISIFLCNVNAEFQNYDLVTMAGIYVFLIMILNIPIYGIKITCKMILKGVTTADAKQHSVWRLAGCYLLYVVTGLVLVIFYLVAVIQLFIVLGNGSPNQLSIALLFILYTFGLGFQYVSQTTYVDKEFYYVNAINKIRINSEEKEREIKTMAVVAKKNKKFKEVYEVMTDRQDMEEFKTKFKVQFPDE